MQLALLLLAPAPEAVRGRAALLVPALDEARADLGGDEPLALEDADRVAAQAHEQRGDDVVLRERLEQRPELDPLVHARVREAERRPDGDRLVGGLDPRRAVGVGRAAGQPGQRLEPLAHVLASDVARHRRTLGSAREGGRHPARSGLRGAGRDRVVDGRPLPARADRRSRDAARRPRAVRDARDRRLRRVHRARARHRLVPHDGPRRPRRRRADGGLVGRVHRGAELHVGRERALPAGPRAGAGGGLRAGGRRASLAAHVGRDGGRDRRRRPDGRRPEPPEPRSGSRSRCSCRSRSPA